MTDDPILDAVRSVFDATPGYEGAIPLQAVIAVVGMDSDGQKWLSHFRSGDLRTWEARGLVEDLRDTLSAREIMRQMEE